MLDDARLAEIKARVEESAAVYGNMQSQSEADRADLLAEVDRLRARANDVRAIHPRETSAVTLSPVCGSCRDSSEDPMPWPCPTIAELDEPDGTSAVQEGLGGSPLLTTVLPAHGVGVTRGDA
jgi:hypothetical protein